MTLLSSLISGWLIGCVFALLSIGFSLTWGIVGVINIAHAALALLAAYIAYWFLTLADVDPLLSLLLIVPLYFIAGQMLYYLLFRPVTRARDPATASVVMTFGLTIIIENAMAYAWTPDVRVLRTSYIGASFSLGPINISQGAAFGFLIAGASMIVIYLLLHHTYTGKAVRAIWQDPEGAALMGVDANRITGIAFGLAIASAGAAGVAMAFNFAFYPAGQLQWFIFAAMVAILGGTGSVLGAAVGGLALGTIIGLGGVLLPFAWLNTVLFALLAMVLWFRPSGLVRI